MWLQTQFDIETLPAIRAILLALVLAVLQGAAVSAQSLDSTLNDIVSDRIDEQVEEELAAALEDSIVEQIEGQVESTVIGAVEQQIESNVAGIVEQQIESGVVDAIEDQIASGVLGAVEDRLESGVLNATERGLDTTAGEVLGQAGRAVGNRGSGEGTPDTAGQESFAGELDAAGRAIERGVWVILVPSAYRERIQHWGFRVRQQLDLDTLERVLLRVDAPEDREIAEAALELALDAPGTRVDFNHVYRPQIEAPITTDGAVARAETGSTAKASLEARLTFGLIDTAIATHHDALASADIEQRDFVPFAAARPTAHGTAIASILVGQSDRVRGLGAGARLRAASVFFRDKAGNEVATTAGLAAALEWLASREVDVINMSLAGPANLVLEAAVDAVNDRGIVVVAAVGNNGPNGEPLYPAAYGSVVGVTAVDSLHRIYAYAGRGRHVMFAAPGVKIGVARSGGGYGVETGTSMAAPYVAAVIARALARTADAPRIVLEKLKAAAIDLGAPDFDEIFGFGLIRAQP